MLEQINIYGKNNCEWLVTMRLSDWIMLYSEYGAGSEDTNER
jgi:hypothetical protein